MSNSQNKEKVTLGGFLEEERLCCTMDVDDIQNYLQALGQPVLNNAQAMTVLRALMKISLRSSCQILTFFRAGFDVSEIANSSGKQFNDWLEAQSDTIQGKDLPKPMPVHGGS